MKKHQAVSGEVHDLLAKVGLKGVSPLVLALLVALAIPPLFIRDEFILRLFLIALYFGAQAMVFDFSAGLINVVNFGFAAFIGLGGYTSALMVINLGVSPWIGMVCGAVVAMVFGLLVGLLTLRLRGIYASVMTWFLALGLMTATAATPDLTRGYWGLNVPPLLDTYDTLPYYYILLPMVIVMYVVLSKVAHSYIGLAFRGIGQNMLAARASGVNPAKYRVMNFTLACAFAGLLGGFYAHFIGILTPAIMDTGHTMEVLTMSYVGGKGSLWGGIIAALLFIPTFEYMKSLMELRLIIYGGILVLVMVFWPGGIAAAIRVISERRRRKAGSEG